MPAKIRRKAAPAPATPQVSAAGPSPALSHKKGPVRKVSNRALVQFTTQLATLSEAGLPIVRALSILQGQLPPGPFQQVLAAVAEDVAGGTSLSDALAKHPKAFDRIYVNMVRAGEVGGVLDQILRRLASFLEKTQEIRDRIRGAMAYPIVVTIVAIAVLSIVFVLVIPKFEEIFRSFDIELPVPTEILIRTSGFVAGYWYLVFGLPVALWLGLRESFRRNEAFRRLCHKRTLRLPAVGKLVLKTLVARFARTFGTLISSGVPHLEALAIVKGSSGNLVVADAIDRIRASVREGEGLSRPMQDSGVFDDLVVNMVDVGEQTGELDRMLLKVADAYEAEVDQKLGIFFKVLEPALLVFMAVVVGFVVISLFLPLLKIMETLGTG